MSEPTEDEIRSGIAALDETMAANPKPRVAGLHTHIADARVLLRLLDEARAEAEANRRDVDRLDAVQRHAWHLIPIEFPTGNGDSDVGWTVRQTRMGKGDVVIALVADDNPRAAVDAAMQEPGRG